LPDIYDAKLLGKFISIPIINTGNEWLDPTVRIADANSKRLVKLQAGGIFLEYVLNIQKIELPYLFPLLLDSLLPWLSRFRSKMLHNPWYVNETS
jgi:hypothetical protein